MFKEIFEKGHNELTNEVIHAYLYHKEGYLVEADIFIRVHPYVSQNLYVDMFIRSRPSYEEALLVNEFGRIEGATQGIHKFLELHQSSTTPLHIKQISDELNMLNNAYNVVRKKDEDENSPQSANHHLWGRKNSITGSAKLSANRILNSAKLKTFVGTVEAAMDYHKALEMYNYYTSDTNQIHLSPLKLNQGFLGQDNQQQQQQCAFFCQVSSLKLRNSYYNLISLEKASPLVLDKRKTKSIEIEDEGGSTSINTLNMQERQDNIDPLPSLHPHSLVPKESCLSDILRDNNNSNLQPKYLSLQVKTSRFSSEFAALPPSSQRFSLRNSPYSLPLQDTTYNTSRQNDFLDIISPTTSHRYLLKSSSSPTGRQKQRLPFSFPISNNEFDEAQNPSQSQSHNTRAKKEEAKILKATGSVSSNQYSKISQISTVFRTFERAVNTKSYQKSFNFLCIFFYGVILATLACEILLKTILDDTMNNLIVKNNLLNYAQLRTYHTTKIENTARGSGLILAGALTPSQLTGADSQLKGSILNLEPSLTALIEANEGIIHHLHSENSDIKEMLFQKDINIKGTVLDPTDTKASQWITSFQQVDVITYAMKYIIGLDPLASPEGGRAFSFLVSNTLNDFLAKNEEITQAFLASLNKQKDSLQTMINLSVIVLPLLLAGIVLLLSVIIYIQYTTEKHYLLAFLKLNPQMINSITENLKLFQKKLTNQEKFETELVPSLLYKLDRSTQFKHYHKKEFNQKIRYSDMKKRYVGYIFRVLFYMSLLILIVVINYIFIWKATQKIYRQQRQIQFANEISSTLSVTYVATVETFASNNTNKIMRQHPHDVWKAGVVETERIQSIIYKEFQLEDGDYDPEVKAILFEEVPCTRFTAAPYDSCKSLITLGQSTKMISALTLYQNWMQTKLLAYASVDKSAIGNLIGAALVNLSYLLGAFSVAAAEAQLVNEVINKSLEKSVDDLYDLGTNILIVFTLTLVAVSALIWFQILTKVKEVNNDFKKVLAVFPPNIILSSFLLKSFLNKTSNMAQKL